MNPEAPVGDIFTDYWKLIILCRWTITNLLLVFLRSHPEIQMMLLLMLSVLFQIIMIHGKPYPDKSDQRMAVFNEIAAALYLYIMMLLTDFWGENDLRNEVGWALLFFLIFVVTVNLTKVFASFISWLKAKIKKYRNILQSKKTVGIKPNQERGKFGNQTTNNSIFTLDDLSPNDRHLINNSHNPTVSYTHVGRMGVEEQVLNLKVDKSHKS